LFLLSLDPAHPNIYTLSLHDALPICLVRQAAEDVGPFVRPRQTAGTGSGVHSTALGLSFPVLAVVLEASRAHGFQCPERRRRVRSEEHTSELQSLAYLVCRLLLEKKK